MSFPEAASLGAHIVRITPEPPGSARSARAEEVLADIDVEVQRLLKLTLLDPAAHGRLVPVQARGERGAERTTSSSGRVPRPGPLMRRIPHQSWRARERLAVVAGLHEP